MIDKTPFFTPPGGSFQDLIGSPIASASRIAPDRLIHHVTGTSTIINITPPYEGFFGPIYLIPDEEFYWSGAGNIAVGGTAVVGKAIPFVYDPETSKWYTLSAPEPFTVLAGLTGVVPILINALDFIGDDGDYGGFEISLDPSGPWETSYTFTDAGLITVYIRGEEAGGYLIKSTQFTGA